MRILLWLAAVATLIVAVYAFWRMGHGEAAPAGIVAVNGRLEAIEIDLAAKYGGRVVDVAVHEGDSVRAGQVLVRLDTAELEAERRAAEADLRRAEQGRRYAEEQVAVADSELGFSRREVARSTGLAEKSHISREKLDADRTRRQKAQAGLQALRASVGESAAAVAAGQARIEQLRARIAESTLAAPKDGRVLYRLAEPGEVLPPGGKALTLLDMADVYMTLFLPEDEAGKIAMNAEARIVLDALPDQALPARVSFVSPQAQFTPKQVETFRERQKLVFRVKAQVDAGFLALHADLAKPGLPGMGYIRLEPSAPWPAPQR